MPNNWLHMVSCTQGQACQQTHVVYSGKKKQYDKLKAFMANH